MFSAFRSARLTLQRFALSRGRSPLWPEARRKHLLIQPVCQACGGKEKLQVHHKAPFHLHPELELAESNLITLCEKPSHDCHFVFGHFHNWSLYNPNVVEDVNRYYLESQAARKRLSATT
jgi:5-methylcytosine-specific restriction protein A